MADIVIDLIDGGDYSKESDNGRISERATRMAIVRGISSVADPAGALVQARAIVEAAYPVGTSYASGSLARLVGYHSEGLPQDDDLIRVRLIFGTPFGEGGSPGEPVWQIEDDSEDQSVETQIDPATGNPLVLVWVNPLNPMQIKTDIATVTIGQSWRRIVLTGILTADQVATYRAAQHSVNDGFFEGRHKGGWWFRRLATHTRPGAAYWHATVELVSKRGEDWSTYAIYRDPDGKFVLPPAGVVAAIRALPYSYGVQSANGVLKIGPMETENFSSLFIIP